MYQMSGDSCIRCQVIIVSDVRYSILQIVCGGKDLRIHQ